MALVSYYGLYNLVLTTKSVHARRCCFFVSRVLERTTARVVFERGI